MPYTTNVAGTTITAAYGNANIRDQVVTPFASSAARTSAISSPVAGMVSWLTDQNRLDVYDGSAYQLVAHPVLAAFRTSDATGITSSTSLTSDAVLTIPVLASATYEMDALVIYSAGGGAGTGQIKMGFSGPASATLSWLGVGLGVNAGSTTISTAAFDGSIISDSRSYGAAGTSVPCGVMLRGVLTTAGSTGSLTMQFAQAASSATATTVKAGSRLSLRRVA